MFRLEKIFFLSKDPPPGIARNCYGHAAGGMPLAFTQEDFLVPSLRSLHSHCSTPIFMFEKKKTGRLTHISYLFHRWQNEGLPTVIPVCSYSEVDFLGIGILFVRFSHSQDGIRRTHFNVRPP